MKKTVSLILSLLCTVLCIFSVSCSSGEKGAYSMELTIVDSMTKCDSVTDEWFFAYAEDGEWYKVLWDDTDGLSDGDRVTVQYDEITQIDYTQGYPDGFTPSKQIQAKKVTKR